MPYSDPEQQREARRRYEARKGRPSGSRRRPVSANAARRKAVATREFIAVDGEGANRSDGGHDYFLLTVGEESLYHTDGRALTTKEIFEFLYRQRRKHPEAIFVGYYLGYDFACWFKGLPESRARMLFTTEGQAARKPKTRKNPTPFPVDWGVWQFDLLPPARRFKLRPGEGNPWLYIMDVGPFFQCAFLDTLTDKKGNVDTDVCSIAEYELLREGKGARAEIIDGPPPPEMIRYNVTENLVLARLMNKFRAGTQAAGFKLERDQWFGPGQLAENHLKNVGAPRTVDIIDAVPLPALEAARLSYFGGWFEIMRHGLQPGLTYEYDINSAYPDVIAKLPCLCGQGRWEYRAGRPAKGAPYALVYGSVAGQTPVTGPMPHRTPWGRVLRPQASRGWYWLHEVEASRRAGLCRQLQDVSESWSFWPCDHPAPLRGVADLYTMRQQVGKNTPQGVALKLAYNSMYGKMAQSQGDPKFANPVWASLITTGCRVAILDAIASHPKKSEALVMVATDGVYFDSPHPDLPLSDKLGDWEGKAKSNLTLFMPGIYWDDTARHEGRLSDLKSRGVPARALANFIREIDEQFAAGRWPKVELAIPFSIVSPRLALARGKWETAGLVSRDAPRVMNALPEAKRKPLGRLESMAYLPRAIPVDDRAWLASEWVGGVFPVSTGYDKRFGMEFENIVDAGEEVTPDGLGTADHLEMIRG